jgi:PHP family Zn ribbon phosphoesterase
VKQQKQRSLLDISDLNSITVENSTHEQLVTRSRALEEQLAQMVIHNNQLKLQLGQYETKTWCPGCEQKVKIVLKLSCAICAKCSKVVRQ